MSVELAKIAEESARGSLSLMTGAAASTAIGAVASILVARLLEPSGYGLYSLAFVLPVLFVSVADLGISPALTRFAASLRSQGGYLRLASMIGSAIFMNVTISSAAFLLLFGFAGPLATLVINRENMKDLIMAASLIIIFQGVFNLSYNTLIGLDRADQSALTIVVPDIVRMVMSPALILIGYGVVGAITGQLSGWGLACVLGMWFLLGHRRALRKQSSTEKTEGSLRQDMRAMMGYGLPLYVGTLLLTVVDQYQNVVLAFFTTNAEIGNLSVATNFGALVGIVATPVMTVLFPAFSKLDPHTRKKELQGMFQYSVKYTTLLILPIAVIVASFSKDLILVVYGADYTSAPAYLTLYATVFLLTGLGSYVVTNFLSGIGKTTETVKIILVQLMVLLPLAPVMAWFWRVPGVIIGSVSSVLIATAFGLRLVVRKYDMRVDLKSSLASIITALAAVLPVLPLAWYSLFPSLVNVVLGATIYLIIYLTLAPILRAVRRADIQILKSVFVRVKPLKPIMERILAYEAWVLDGFRID
jgi:O-antigen/teichoic acid export membrane protein